MAEAEKMNGKLGKDDVALCVKALQGLKSSILRSKTKDANDAEMVMIYDKRIAQVDTLIAKMYSKELF